MTAYTQPTQWTHALGNNADVSTLPDDTAGTTGLASLQKLFQLINQTPLAAGGVAPSREDFNALFKLLGESIFYMQNGGVWTYNAKYDYKVGRVVLHTDGNLYKCIKDNGVSSAVKAPTDSTYWIKISTMTDVAAVDAKTATNKQDIAAIKSNYVTTNSQQNITAMKVWETSSGNPIFFRDTRFSRATAPSADIFNSLVFVDKNSANLGYMQICQRKDSNNALYIAANRDKNGQSEGIALGLIIPRDTSKAGYATAPSTPSSATANEIATAKFVNDKISSITTDYVTTNTAQTISGQKTFSYQSEPIHIKDARFDVSTKPSTNVNNSVVIFDKNNKQVGYYQVTQESNGNNSANLTATHYKTDGTIVRGSIRVGVNNTGATYTYAPTPGSSSNDTSIATTKWVNDKVNPIKNDYVTATTAQEVTGAKVFSHSGSAIALKDPSIDVSATPKTTMYHSFILKDKNNKNVGMLQFSHNTNNEHTTAISAIAQKTDGTNLFSSILVACKSDGTYKTSCPSPASNSNDTSIATTAWVNSKISANQANVPTGIIIPFAGSSIPAGFLLCNGAAVSRTTYAKLFNVIGTTWGAGDGSTTFKLPDARGRFPEGANGNLGTYHAAGLPNITGDTGMESGVDGEMGATSYSGCFYSGANGTSTGIFYTRKQRADLIFSATKSNAVYGKATTVQPTSLCVQYLIKY